MKKENRKWGIVTLILAVGIHYFVVLNIPSAFMQIGMKRLSEKVKNDFWHSQIPKAGKDIIVKMSPDILYSSSVYDVSENPIRYRFQYPPKDSYWSVGLYDARNTDNVYTLNDRTARKKYPKGEVVLVLTQAEANYQAQANEEVVILESPKGLLLNRMIVSNPYKQAECDSISLIQHKAKMEKIE